MHARRSLLVALGACLLIVTPTAAAAPAGGTPSDQRRLELERVIRGWIAPKSVVATGAGDVFAQNSSWAHTVTVYGRRGGLLATIANRIRLSRFGFERWDRPVRGGPVEGSIRVHRDR